MPKKQGSHPPGQEIVVMVTASGEEEAARIGRAVVEAGLAACANILPRIRSIYHWEGTLADEGEALILIKTRFAVFEALEAAVRKLHSYKVPEIIALPIMRGSQDYLRWIHLETSKSLKSRGLPKSI